jgi:hypothetical protein
VEAVLEVFASVALLPPQMEPDQDGAGNHRQQAAVRAGQ